MPPETPYPTAATVGTFSVSELIFLCTCLMKLHIQPLQQLGLLLSVFWLLCATVSWNSIFNFCNSWDFFCQSIDYSVHWSSQTQYPTSTTVRTASAIILIFLCACLFHLHIQPLQQLRLLLSGYWFLCATVSWNSVFNLSTIWAWLLLSVSVLISSLCTSLPNTISTWRNYHYAMPAQILNTNTIKSISFSMSFPRVTTAPWALVFKQTQCSFFHDKHKWIKHCSSTVTWTMLKK